nr:Transposase IS200 like [uncultured bacterium]
MPHKNVLRTFVPDAVYHCYNRGVEKRQTFMDEQDYGVFLNRLKQMLSYPEDLDESDRVEHIKSYYGDVELLAYRLMPNHFHLLLYQHSERALSEFMRTLSTSYTMYFNNRYQRVGSLFQGTYKARLVSNEADWLNISRYIHLNPLAMPEGYLHYQYSSMRSYMTRELCPSWLLPERVLDSFSSLLNYAEFVEYAANHEKLESIQNNYSLE